MEVNCEGCAGCCIDWRPLAEVPSDHERRGPRRPLDDVYNLVPLTRDEVRDFLRAGYGDALAPRLWTVDPDDDTPSVEIDGYDLAAIDDRPAFFVGLRKAPKPVAPFGTDGHWLPTCAFLDPTTLQCRIHDDDLYPGECSDYPGRNLALDVETECERVEAAFGGSRLLDDTAPEDARPLLGPHALGVKVFTHDPASLTTTVERLASREPTAEDRATFIAAAAAHAPGTTEINEEKYAAYYERALTARSWVGDAIREWRDRESESSPDPELGERVEDERGAPGTPGWE